MEADGGGDGDGEKWRETIKIDRQAITGSVVLWGWCLTQPMPCFSRINNSRRVTGFMFRSEGECSKWKARQTIISAL